MIDRIHWLGHDSFRLEGSRTVYIDPWKLHKGAPAADIVLVTHEHHDHLSPSDIAAIATAGTVVCGPPSVVDELRGLNVTTLRAGETVEVAGVTITTVAAYNLDKFRSPGELYHPPAAGGLGYVITLDGARIYHAGDTDAVPEMAAVECDVALLPVGGTYTMTAEEAAGACDLFHATEAVPMHYGEVVGSVADARRFASLCRIPVTIMEAESR